MRLFCSTTLSLLVPPIPVATQVECESALLLVDSRGIALPLKRGISSLPHTHGWVSPHCGQQVIKHSLLHSLYFVIVKFTTNFLSSLPFTTFVNSLPNSRTVFLLTCYFPLFRPFYLLAGSSPLTHYTLFTNL